MSAQTPPTELSESVQKKARRDVAAWLTAFVERHGGFVGSVHLADSAVPGQILLIAAHNLPARIQNAAAVVPIGKGVAGVAAQRREPIVMADLQLVTADRFGGSGSEPPERMWSYEYTQRMAGIRCNAWFPR